MEIFAVVILGGHAPGIVRGIAGQVNSHLPDGGEAHYRLGFARGTLDEFEQVGGGWARDNCRRPLVSLGDAVHANGGRSMRRTVINAKNCYDSSGPSERL